MKPSVKTTARRPKFDLTPISVDEALSNPALAGIESTLRQLAGLDDKPTSVVEPSDSGDFYPHDGNIEVAKPDSSIGDIPTDVSPIGDSPVGYSEARTGRVAREPPGVHGEADSMIGLGTSEAPLGIIPSGNIPIGVSRVPRVQPAPTRNIPIGNIVDNGLDSWHSPTGDTPVGESQVEMTESDELTSWGEPVPTGDIPIGSRMQDSAEADARYTLSGSMPIGGSCLDGREIDNPVLSAESAPLDIQLTDESRGTGESSRRGAGEIGLPGDVTDFDVRGLALPGVAAQPPRYRQKIRLASDVQDGHSNGEQLLYQALWRVGKQETPETKLVTIGYGGMHDIAKLDRSNCKKNILSLIEKLAVETVGKHSVQRNVGKTYRVYSYSAILRRRKQAGMLYIVRANGVRFVRPDENLLTGYQVSLTHFQMNHTESPIGYTPIGGLVPPQSELPIGNIDNPPIAPLGKIHIGPIGEAPRVYKKPKEETNNLTQQTSTTSIVEATLGQLSKSLNEVLPFIDDQAVRFLWSECRSRVADCSVSEVIYFTKAKAAVLAGGKIQNPIGFLLAAVPKCFEGQSFLAFRRAQREQEDAETRLRLQREETQRQAEEDTKREIEVYTRAEETLNSMSQNDRESLRQNVTRDYLKRYPSARHMPDFESWIRRMMIREIVKKPGGFSKEQ